MLYIIKLSDEMIAGTDHCHERKYEQGNDPRTIDLNIPKPYKQWHDHGESQDEYSKVNYLRELDYLFKCRHRLRVELIFEGAACLVY